MTLISKVKFLFSMVGPKKYLQTLTLLGMGAIQGFHFSFWRGGGNGPPPEGGDTRGGIRVPRGGNGA